MEEDKRDIDIESLLILEQGDENVFEVAKMTDSDNGAVFTLSMIRVDMNGNPSMIGSPAIFSAEELLDLSAALRNIACEQLNQEDAETLGLEKKSEKTSNEVN